MIIAVVGAHLSGLPLNSQLTERGGKLISPAKTAANYKLFALPNTTPPKPGLLRVPAGAASIELELWELGPAEFGSFVDAVPPPMCIGNIELEDGRWVNGFLCEPYALEGATEITHFGGWRAFIASLKK